MRKPGSKPEYEFDIGPSFTWKPSALTRLDVAALFGTTSDSPALSIYAVFSIAFGDDGNKGEKSEAWPRFPRSTADP